MHEARTNNARRFYGSIKYQADGQKGGTNQLFELYSQQNKEKEQIYQETMDNLRKFYDVKRNILYVKSLKEE